MCSVYIDSELWDDSFVMFNVWVIVINHYTYERVKLLVFLNYWNVITFLTAAPTIYSVL